MTAPNEPGSPHVPAVQGTGALKDFAGAFAGPGVYEAGAPAIPWPHVTAPPKGTR
jgi:hypothetical protein